MTTINGEHELLLRHFDDWARRKGRSPDLQLLDELLHLRAAYDELPATSWPERSVEHLFTERWPAKGPVETPDPAVVVETLDAYFRFLRSTGRMAARSQEPATLLKEVRRFAKRMGALASDEANWSLTKSLVALGRERGIDIDQAPDEATLRQRVEEVMDLWNELPLEERRRRSPALDRVETAMREEHSGQEVAMDRHDVGDPVLALLLTFQGRLPTGRLSGADVVANIARSSRYLQSMIALAAWVGERREVTTTGVLRPALAREVSEVLGLGAWQRGQLERRYPDGDLPAGVARVGREAWIQQELDRPWRSAVDHTELHRLWVGAISAGLIETKGKSAHRVLLEELDDERTVEVVVRALVGLALHLSEHPYSFAGVSWAMLESYVDQSRRVDKSEIQAFLVNWHWSPVQQREWDEMLPGWRDRYEGSTCSTAVGLLADTGLYVEDESSVTLTPLGDVFVTTWLEYLAA